MDNSNGLKQELKTAEHKLETAFANAETAAVKTERNLIHHPWVRTGGAVAALMLIAGVLVYWRYSSTRVYVDTSMISAPTISLSPAAPGTLQEVYVSEGDTVAADQPVAKVGDQLLKAKISGVVLSVQTNVGAQYNPGQAVVTMMDPSQLRAVATIDENKGLDKIQVGQEATFTVDAFGSKTYQGVVDEVSPTAHQTGVVFNISDQRPTQTFDIKIRFDQQKYPELKNGMSAKVTVYTN